MDDDKFPQNITHQNAAMFINDHFVELLHLIYSYKLGERIFNRLRYHFSMLYLSLALISLKVSSFENIFSLKTK